ncbi:MAG: pyridoxamine 5'-phosphate oxidase family protein [Candidatus Eisenbacteria bacterium]
MASFFPLITPEQAALIESCALFFVASADPLLADGPEGEGPVNLSPKGGVTLHMISPRRVAYLDVNGSGNETARHARAGGPVTVMVCSFTSDDAAIVRLYGQARAVPLEQSVLAGVLEGDARGLMSAPRQVIEVDIERTMTSCGYGVPVMNVVRERQKTDRGRRYKPAM